VAHSLVHRIHLVCTLLQLYYVMHERAVSRMYRNRDVYWTKVQYTTYAATIVIFFGKESPGGQQGGLCSLP
jgi:hypothetical protein